MSTSKSLVNTAIARLITDRDTGAIDDYFAPDFVQHSTRIQAGPEGLQSFVRNLLESSSFEPARTLAQDDLVVTHGVYRGQGDQPLVAFELWRVADGKIVEHWDALEPEVRDTVSGRSMVDGPTEVARPAATAESKALVERFVHQVLVEGDVSQLADYFVAGLYAQHNPQIGDDLTGLGQALEALAAQGLTMTYTRVHRTVAEGEFVFVQAEGTLGTQPTAFYDLFRVEDGKIAEHWDVVFPVPESLPHNNGLF